MVEAASRAFAALARTPGVRNSVVRIEDGKGRVIFAAAHGEARPGVSMLADSVFHLASVAKTMTAAIVLGLWEEGALGEAGLETSFVQFGVFPDEVAQRLHSQADRISVRHLLTHTSGIRDAMEDDAQTLGGPAPNSLIGRMMGPHGDIRRSWAPWDASRPDDAEAGVINYFFAGAAKAPLSPPGARFHYSDTGFMLLALLIERLTGRTYVEALRARIFTPLGLQDTYLAYRDDPATLGPLREPEAEYWAGDIPMLSAGVNLSFDWGGGGVVSSAGSLITFLRALRAGALFKRRETAAAMQAWIAPDGLAAPRTGVGLGLFRTELGGLELIGHSGASGAKMFYAPAHDFYIAGTINQTQGPADWHWAIAQAIAALELPS